MRSNEINWSDCIGVCTDGAAAMTGRQSGVVQRIKEVAPLAVSTHCFLHREALATKEMEPSLRGVLRPGHTKPTVGRWPTSGRRRATVGLVCLVCSTCRLTSAAVCPIQHRGHRPKGEL